MRVQRIGNFFGIQTEPPKLVCLQHYMVVTLLIENFMVLQDGKEFPFLILVLVS